METRSAMPRTTPAGPLTVVTVMALVAGSCGGSDEPDPTGPGEETPDASRLVMGPIGPQMAGAPFEVTVTLADAQGSPVAAETTSTISLAVETGDGTLDGPASASLAAGTSSVTLAGLAYDLAETDVRLVATGTGGSAAGLAGISETFDVGFESSGPLIAFRRTSDTDQDVYLTTPDGGAFVNLSDHPAADSDPAWSPDGSRLAFVSTRTGEAEVFIVNADGTGLTQVTDGGGARWPSWSPDGNWIAYSANVDGQRDLYAVQVGASLTGPRAADGFDCQLTDSPAVDNEPVWLPDGSMIFYSNRDGHGAVYRFEFDCTGLPTPVKITIDQVFSCSPGKGGVLLGSRVVVSYLSDEGGNENIWIMDADGSNRVNLTDHPATDWASSFAPPWEGSAAGLPGAWWASPRATAEGLPPVIFDSDRSGSWDLHVIDADGTGVTRLTSHPADDEFPAWRPPPSPGSEATIRIPPGGVTSHKSRSQAAAPASPTWSFEAFGRRGAGTDGGTGCRR